MATLKSNNENLVLNADGAGSNVLLQHNGTTAITLDNSGNTTIANNLAVSGTVGNLSSSGTLTATTTVTAGTTVSDQDGNVRVGRKNLIINGDMRISQRGVSFTAPADGDYTLDRWRVVQTTAGVVDVLQAADAPTASEAGVYVANCVHADVTTADTSIAAGDVYGLMQRIEGYNIAPLGFGQSGTRYITITFWVKATKTGIYCVSIANAAGDRSYPTEYTVNSSDTWEKKEVTIAVDTTGTWLYTNGVGINLYFTMACGSTYQGTADTWQAGIYFATANQVNALDSTSNNFKITLVQLEAGQAATTFESRQYGEELALCQRYYQRLTYNDTGLEFSIAYCYSTTAALGVWNFHGEMRTAPTGNYSSTSALGITANAGSHGSSAISFYGSNKSNVRIDVTTSGIVAGEAGTMYIGTASWIEADAEL